MKSIEEISHERYERNRAKINALPRQPLRPWEVLNEAEKDIVRVSTQEVIDAYLGGIEGMPSVDECRIAWMEGYDGGNGAPFAGIEAVRTIAAQNLELNRLRSELRQEKEILEAFTYTFDATPSPEDQPHYVPSHILALVTRQRDEAQAQIEPLREAFEAARAFINSHAADPDLTAEMCAAYDLYNQKSAALSAPPPPVVPMGAQGLQASFDWSKMEKGSRYTMWRPTGAPTSKDTERAEFEKAWQEVENPKPSEVWDGESAKNTAWQVWQIKAKQEAKP